MSPGPTFDRVYLALKAQLTSARLEPGCHLEPSALGDELSASITPVRDALHRLVGERLVDAPRNDGFRVPAPTEAQLRDLYGWNRTLLELALRRGSAGRTRGSASAIGNDHSLVTSAGPADLFRAVVALSGSPEHGAALEGLNDRLAAVRAVEEQHFADWSEEFETLRQALASDDVRGHRRAIAAYHRRRQRSVPELLVVWRRHAAGG
jgi:DNA-binding FadR family transcriptional regulator